MREIGERGVGRDGERGRRLCRRNGAIAEFQRRAESEYSRHAAADQAARRIVVGKAVIGRENPADTEFVPTEHAVAIRRHHAGAEKGLGCIVAAIEIAGDADQRLRRRHHVDQRPNRRIGSDQLHRLPVIVDAIGRGIAGAEEEITAVENLKMADALDEVGLEAGKEISREGAEDEQR